MEERRGRGTKTWRREVAERQRHGGEKRQRIKDMEDRRGSGTKTGGKKRQRDKYKRKEKAYGQIPETHRNKDMAERRGRGRKSGMKREAE